MRFAGSLLEVKQLTDAGLIEGYGSVFGIVDSFGEMVMPGAFAESIEKGRAEKRTAKMLWQHAADQPIGVWDELREDQTGLFAKGRLLIESSPKAAEAHALLKAGAMDGLSIGYQLIESKPHPTKPNVLQLKKLDLKEISVVTFPANEEARATVKSITSARDIAELLHEAGWSGRRAKAAAGAAWKALNQLEDEDAADTELAALIAASTARLCNGVR